MLQVFSSPDAAWRLECRTSLCAAAVCAPCDFVGRKAHESPYLGFSVPWRVIRGAVFRLGLRRNFVPMLSWNATLGINFSFAVMMGGPPEYRKEPEISIGK